MGNGIYRGFDGDGRLVALSTTVRREKLLGILAVSHERVSVALAEESTNHRDKLNVILLCLRSAAGKAEEAVTAMTFEELVTAASSTSRVIRRSSTSSRSKREDAPTRWCSRERRRSE